MLNWLNSEKWGGEMPPLMLKPLLSAFPGLWETYYTRADQKPQVSFLPYLGEPTLQGAQLTQYVSYHIFLIQSIFLPFQTLPPVSGRPAHH